MDSNTTSSLSIAGVNVDSNLDDVNDDDRNDEVKDCGDLGDDDDLDDDDDDNDEKLPNKTDCLDRLGSC